MAQSNSPLFGKAMDQRGGIISWVVLLIFSLNTALNAFVYMNTSAAEEKFSQILDHEVGKLYGYFLLTVMVGMTPGMFIGVKCEGLALGFSVCMNVGSAWLRWICVDSGSYDLCLVSVLVNAAGAWTILALPAQISQQRFHKDQWTLTTSIAVQANYFGWLIGAILPPQFKTEEAIVKMCLVQAVIATPILVIMFLCYRPASKLDKEEGSVRRQELSASVLGEDIAGGHSMDDGSFCKLFMTCLRHPMYFFQVLGFGALGGVSFAQPSAAIFILGNYGFENDVSFWVNVAFIGVGVISGLVIGKLCTDAAKFGMVLKSLFVGCTVCNGLCAALAESGFISSDNMVSLYITMFLSAGVGMTSLGFIGVAIEAAALYPVGAGYACWFVEIIVQAVGGGLCFWVNDRHGFTKLAAVSALSTLLVFLCYREPPKEGTLAATH